MTINGRPIFELDNTMSTNEYINVSIIQILKCVTQDIVQPKAQPQWSASPSKGQAFEKRQAFEVFKMWVWKKERKIVYAGRKLWVLCLDVNPCVHNHFCRCESRLLLLFLIGSSFSLIAALQACVPWISLPLLWMAVSLALSQCRWGRVSLCWVFDQSQQDI